MADQANERRPLLHHPLKSAGSFRQDSFSVKGTKFPVAVCGLALGVVGLGHVWEATTRLMLPAWEPWPYVFVWFTCLISALLLIFYIVEMILNPGAFMKELEDREGACSLCAMPMALMSIAGVFAYHDMIVIALIIWIPAALLDVCFVGWILVYHVPVLTWTDISPIFFVPLVGIGLAGSTGASLGVPFVPQALLLVGTFFFLVLFPCLIYRGYFYEEPPREDHLIYYAIFAAPAAVVFAGWASLEGFKDSFANYLIFFFVCVGVLIFLTRLPELLSISFGPRHAVLTFPAAISTKAFVIFYAKYALDSYWAFELEYVCYALVLATTILISVLAVLISHKVLSSVLT